MDEVVTCLEMTSPTQLVRGRLPPAPLEMEEVGPDAASVVRSIYVRIGTPLCDVDESRQPTAQTSFAAATATALRLVERLLVLALGTTFQVPGTDGEVVVVAVAACVVVGAGFAARPCSAPVPATTPKAPLASRTTARIGIRITFIVLLLIDAAARGTAESLGSRGYKILRSA